MLTSFLIDSTDGGRRSCPLPSCSIRCAEHAAAIDPKSSRRAAPRPAASRAPSMFAKAPTGLSTTLLVVSISILVACSEDPLATSSSATTSTAGSSAASAASTQGGAVGGGGGEVGGGGGAGGVEQGGGGAGGQGDPFPGILGDGVRLIGRADTGHFYFSWVRFLFEDGTHGSLDTLEVGCDNCTAYLGCINGPGTFSVDASTVTIDLQEQCGPDKSLEALLIHPPFRDFPPGHSLVITFDDPGKPIVAGYKYDVSQCDADFTVCTSPFVDPSR